MIKTFHSGFSLIELIFILMIIGLLMVIAVPTYEHFIHKTQVKQAKQHMNMIAYELENYYVQHATYQGISLKKLNYPKQITGYKFSITNASKQDYQIKAEAIKSDYTCQKLLLDQNGKKQAYNAKRQSITEYCWNE
jgi:Tfp pilus assembly protein PilE